MNLFTKENFRHRKQTCVTKGETEKGINQKFGINRYILLYIKQIFNKDLLYSTGNSVQYFIIISKEKESEKECIYKGGSLFCAPETNTL